MAPRILHAMTPGDALVDFAGRLEEKLAARLLRRAVLESQPFRQLLQCLPHALDGEARYALGYVFRLLADIPRIDHSEGIVELARWVRVHGERAARLLCVKVD